MCADQSVDDGNNCTDNSLLDRAEKGMLKEGQQSTCRE